MALHGLQKRGLRGLIPKKAGSAGSGSEQDITFLDGCLGFRLYGTEDGSGWWRVVELQAWTDPRYSGTRYLSSGNAGFDTEVVYSSVINTGEPAFRAFDNNLTTSQGGGDYTVGWGASTPGGDEYVGLQFTPNDEAEPLLADYPDFTTYASAMGAYYTDRLMPLPGSARWLTWANGYHAINEARFEVLKVSNLGHKIWVPVGDPVQDDQSSHGVWHGWNDLT